MKINDILIEALSSETDERKVLYDYYVKMLEDLQKAKLLIDEQEKKVRLKISEYKNGEHPRNSLNKDVFALDTLSVADKDYPLKGSWADKIVYVLQRSNKSLTGKEIIERLKVLQPDLADKNISSSVHPTLSDNSGEGKRLGKQYDAVVMANRFTLNKK